MTRRTPRPGLRAFLAGSSTLLLGATWAFGADRWRVEHAYVEGLGVLTTTGLSTLTGWVPTSLAEWVELGAGIVVVAWLVAAVVRLRRASERAEQLLRLVGEAWAAVAVSLWLFYVTWGLAYSRPRIEKRLGWTEDFELEVDELSSLAEALVRHVNDLYLLQHDTDDTGVMTGVPLDGAAIDAAVDIGWQRLVVAEGLHPSVARSRGPTKPLISSGLFTLMGIGGFYFPYTGEANINTWAPAWQQPHTRAHEMAHQRLFASENEANFLGFLACIHSDDPLVRYSGWLFAQRQVLRSLLKLHQPTGKRHLLDRLPGVQTDVNLAHAFWTRYDGELSDLSTQVNDLYLKANNVEGGVKSYGLSLRLMVRWARRCGALPMSDDVPLSGTLGDCDPIE